MNEIRIVLQVIGGLAALLTIALFLFPNLRTKLVRGLKTLSGMSFRYGWDLNAIRDQVAGASKEVMILQTWVPTLNRDLGAWQDLDKNLTVRMLLLDPALVGARSACRNCHALTEPNVSALEQFNSQSEVEIEFAFYEVLPFGPIYIIDDVVYWGIYLSNVDSMVGPQFSCARDSAVGRQIESSFEAIWESSKVMPATLDDGTTNTGSREWGEETSPAARFCSSCGDRLEYRRRGPESALVMESFCSNEECARFEDPVDTHSIS